MSEIKAPEQAPASTFGPADGGPRGIQLPDVVVSVTPTQVRRPWRSTARTVFQALVALAVLAPILVQAAGLDPEQLPWLAIPLGVAAAVTRIMALPQVEEFLRNFVPFLAAAPAPPVDGRRRLMHNEGGVTDLMAAILVVFAAFVVLLLFFFVPGGGR